jgi:hypothetical protein
MSGPTRTYPRGMADDELPPLVPRGVWMALGLAAALAVAYGVAQYRAKPQAALALAFLMDVKNEAPSAAERAAGDALRVVQGERGESSPAFGVARDSTSFQDVGTTVEWGSRCIEVHAYGTVRHNLWVEILEEPRGFRVTRVLTTTPYDGPCSAD